MYARSNTISAQPLSIDDGIAHLRDVEMTQLPEVDGWVGLSLMADRSSGRCILTTAWETEAAMRESRDRARPMRESLAGRFGGRVDLVEEWEIAVLHRDHPSGDSACARCAWVQLPPDRLDQLIDTFKREVLPQNEAIDGFRSASLFVDRATGRAVGATVWSGRDAMEAGREQTRTIRDSATHRVAAKVLDVAEFDLMFAHLRVPEMV